MRKKTSAVAIIVAVLCSIILFPFIFVSGLGSGVVFSLESVMAPDREEDLYQSFVEKGGMDWAYDLFIGGVEQGVTEGMGENGLDINLDAKELFPKDKVETIIYNLYHAVIKGKEYQFDLSYQKSLLKTKLMEYFDANAEEEIENRIRAEYGDEYDMLTESQKQEAKAKALEEARKAFVEETDTMIEEEFGTLEKELSAEINGIYEMPEYQELMALEEEYGYSLTDRTELCAAIRLAGYVLLGFTGVLIALLLLCHMFRPSGFFTAGVFTLLLGGLMVAISKGIPGVLLGLIKSELSAEFAMQEMPGFLIPMIEDVLGWCVTGFDKVGKIGLLAAVVLVLVGILLLIIRRNKAEVEPMSAMEL